MSRTYRALALAALVATAGAQTAIDLRTQSRSVDFSSASFTKPAKMGAALPAACATGEMFFLMSAPAGNNVYGCTEPNTWTLQGGTGTNVYQTFTNALSVDIAHGRNTTAVLVDCYDGSGVQVEYDRLLVASANLVTVSFASAQSGVCVVNTSGGGGGGGGGSGESNTASNVGTAGVGLFRQKSGVDLQFKKINAAGSRIAVTDDSVNNKVDLDVVESALNLGNVGGSLSAAQIGAASKQGNGSKIVMYSGAAPANNNCARWDASGNLTDAGAACGTSSGSTLPDQAGHAGKFLSTSGSAASWSPINQLQGITVAATPPAAGQALIFNAANNRWEPGTVSAAGSLLAGSGIVIGGGNAISVDTATVPSYMTASASLDFSPIAAQRCASMNVTLSGAATQDTVAVGWPPTLEDGLSGIAFVGEPDQVVLRLCNVLPTAVDPAMNNFRVTVIRSF
jgi:hypothetical protein